MKNISKEDWRRRIAQDKDAVILDVRTPKEWNEGVIPKTIKIDIQADDFSKKINELDKSKNYYIYCRSGKRSGRACDLFDSLGFQASFNLIGGILKWDEELVNA
jgi:rhodanese-related sulfurtransferase